MFIKYQPGLRQSRRGMSMSKEEYNFEKAKQGPVVRPAPGKTRITIRIDTDILNWFHDQVHKRGGGNYQTLINDALREYTKLKNGLVPANKFWASKLEQFSKCKSLINQSC